jgi:RecB family exonuclease
VPAHEIALCAPKPGVYRRLVETVAHEYGVPVAVERILGVNPAVAALLNALSLSPDFPWRATFDLLRSPYVDLALWLDAAQVDLLDRLTRERPVVGGLDQWRHALTPLRLADHGDVEDEDLHGVPLVASLPPAELDALRGGLLALFAHLTPPEHAAPAEYVLWIQSALLGLPPELDEDDAGAPDAPPPSLHMLERCDAPGGEDAARDHAAMALLLRSLRQLVDAVALIDGAAAAATERATAPVAWPRFRTDLMNILPAVPVYPPGDVAQVRFDTLAGIRGLTPAHLLVLGLSEGEFPTPPAADVLYSPQERAAEDGLPLREHVSGDDGTLWWQALANVGTSLTLLRPWLDEKGAHWPPSPYWQAVVDLFSGPVVHEIKVSARPQPAQAARDSELLVALAEDGAALTPPGLAISWQLAQRGAGLIRLRSGFTAPGPYEGIITDAALRAQLAQHYGPDHVWSASRLNRYNSCPFGFFVENVLKLMPRPDPEEGADARQRGSLMHAILEALYMRLAAANLAPMSDNATQVLAWLDEACAAAFVDAPQRYGFRPGPLWQQEQAEMQRQLTALVRWECDENGATPRFRPFRQELGFGVRGSVPPVTLADGDGRVLRLRGLIDRVDRADDGGLRIVDYKSGSTEYFGTDIREGRSVQTALYALAAEQLLDGAPVVQSVYLHIPKRKTSGEIDRRKPDQAQELLTAALAAATTAADQIRAGRFPNAPSKRSGNACSGWCDMKDMCRVTRVSVWKARLSAP